MPPQPVDPAIYAGVDGAELNIKVSRVELARADEARFTTFSRAAIESAADAMLAWTQSRMTREVRKIETLPRSVGIALALCGEPSKSSTPWNFDWEQDWLRETNSGRLSRFSPKAHNAVREKMGTWLLGQLTELRQSTGKLPQEVEVSIRVTFPRPTVPDHIRSD